MRGSLLRTLQAPEEKNQKSDHSRGDRGKLRGSDGPVGLDEQRTPACSFDVERPGHEDHACEACCDGENPDATPEESVAGRGHAGHLDIIAMSAINIAMCRASTLVEREDATYRNG